MSDDLRAKLRQEPGARAAPEDDGPVPIDEPIDLTEETESTHSAILQTGKVGGGPLQDTRPWKREASVSGAGAVRMKSFHAKLRPDALEFMEEQINEWLDANPQYEVKFATSSVGDLVGKTKEQALFLTLWL